jgi:hypothetical protein
MEAVKAFKGNFQKPGRRSWDVIITSWLRLENYILEDAIPIDVDLIKDAYEEFKDCAEWREKINDLLPKPEFLRFGDKVMISSNTNTDMPLFIGLGYAPDNLRGKCLMVDKRYRVHVSYSGEFSIITFERIEP